MSTGLLLVTAAAAPSLGAAGGDRDVLWRIVHRCLDAGAPDYCASCPDPIEGSSCAVSNPLRRLQVWAKDSSYLAMRCSGDRCLCGGGFVHGLVLPLSPVTGVEDGRTLEPGMAGAWSFAWDAAVKKIKDRDAIVLLINPPGRRTQDQLHIHIVRLLPGARRALLSRSQARLALFLKKRNGKAPVPGAVFRRMPGLSRVWAAAAQAARSRRFKGYGIAVIRDSPGYLIVVLDGGCGRCPNPEEAFSINSCPAP